MRRKLAAVLLLALSLCAVWWAWPRSADEPADPPAPKSASDENEPGVLLSLPEARPEAATPAPEPVAPTAPTETVEPKADDRLAAHLQGLAQPDGVVTGTLTFLRGFRRKIVPPDGTYDRKGTIWFVLEDLPKEIDPGDTVQVEIRAAGSVPVRAVLAWRDLRREQHADGTRTWHTTIKLTQGVVQSGQVFDPQGTPAAGAVVEAYALHGKQVAPKRHAKATCDADGRFELQLKPHARTMLIAHQDVHAPGWARIEAEPPGTQSLPMRIDLARGHEISGVLRWEGDVPNPQDEWKVTYDVGAEHDIGRGHHGWAVARDGRVVRGWGEVRVAEDGTFVIQGLDLAEHRIVAEGRDEPFPTDSAIADAAQLFVKAPARGLEIDLRPTWLRLEIRTEDGGALVDTALGMESENSGWSSRTADPVSDVRVPAAADTDYSVWAMAKGYRSAVRRLRTGKPGATQTIRLELKRPTEGAPVTLRFSEPDLGTTHFHLVPVDEKGAVRAGEDEVSDDVEPSDGRYTLRVPAGRWRLACYPGRNWGGERPRPWKRIEQTLVIPDAGLAKDLQVEAGGLIRVQVRDAHEAPLPARARVLDARGTPHDVEWLIPRWRGWHTIYTNTFGPDGAGWTKDPLTPGTYTVVVELSGHKTWRRAVEVQRGKTTMVEATLDRDE